MLPTVTTHSSFTKTCLDVGRCLKCGSCSLSSLKQQMLAVIKHIVDDDVICLSGTQLLHAPVHGAHNSVQQLLCKTKLPELWSQQIRAQLN